MLGASSVVPRAGGQGGRGASSAGGRYTAGRRTPAQRPQRCGYETWILVLVFDSDIKLEPLYLQFKGLKL